MGDSSMRTYLWVFILGVMVGLILGLNVAQAQVPSDQTIANSSGADFDPDTCVNLVWDEEGEPQCLDGQGSGDAGSDDSMVVSSAVIVAGSVRMEVTVQRRFIDIEKERKRMVDDPRNERNKAFFQSYGDVFPEYASGRR